GKDLGNGLAELNAGYSNPSNLDATSVRVDHSLNSKLVAFARYNKAPSEITTRGSVLSRFQSSRLDTQTITLGATASLTPRMSNEFRANYSSNGAYLTFGLDNFGRAVPPTQHDLNHTKYDSNSVVGYLRLMCTSIHPLIAILTNI